MNLRSKIFKFLFGEGILRMADDYREGKGSVCCELITALVLSAAITAGATTYTAHRAEKKAAQRQSSLLQFQEEQVVKAETKVAEAEALAAKKATETIKKRKRSATQTIFTSPLGLLDESTVGTKSLLGGA